MPFWHFFFALISNFETSSERQYIYVYICIYSYICKYNFFGFLLRPLNVEAVVVIYILIYTVVLMKFRTSYKNEKKVPKKGKTAKQITRRIQQRFTWNIAHKNRLKKLYMEISSFIDYHEFLEWRKFPHLYHFSHDKERHTISIFGNFRDSRNSW